MSLLEVHHAGYRVGNKKILDDLIKINETLNLNDRYSCSMIKSRVAFRASN